MAYYPQTAASSTHPQSPNHRFAPTPSLTLTSLQEVITPLMSLYTRLGQETQRYAERPNPAPAYLQQRQEFMHRLADCLDALQAIPQSERWLPLTYALQTVQTQDPSLDSVTIHLASTPHPTRTAYLSLPY